MPWKLNPVEFTRDSLVKNLKPGDCFYAPESEDDIGLWPFFYAQENLLTDHYKRENYTRRPLLVWMPGQIMYCVDAKFGSAPGLVDGHVVTGGVDNLTCSKEILFKTVYRGRIENGVISDDLDGKTFHPDGERTVYGST